MLLLCQSKEEHAWTANTENLSFLAEYASCHAPDMRQLPKTEHVSFLAEDAP